MSTTLNDLTSLRDHELRFTSIRETADQELAALKDREITLEQELKRTRELISAHVRIQAESKSIQGAMKVPVHQARPAAEKSPFDSRPLGSLSPSIRKTE
jgi:hypothetical protein